MSSLYEVIGCEPIGAAAGEKLNKYKGKFDPNWLVSHKLDGVSGILYLGKFYSLQGKVLKNTHLIQDIEWDKVPDDRVIFGEIICNELSLEQLSGLVNPNTKKAADGNTFYFNAFDQVPVDIYRIGSTAVDYGTRYAGLFGMGVTPVTQYRFESEAKMLEWFNRLVSQGNEGIVVRNPNAGWFRGRRSTQVLKLVDSPRFDLKVLDIIEGKGKRAGTVGKVVLEFKGKPIKADLGKGFNDERRQEVWDSRESYIGMIADVKCLRVSSTGNSLRLPKVEAFRIGDKLEPDM